MENYFEIVKSDYDFNLGRFNLLVKATKKTNVFEWYLTFYDADGIKVYFSKYNDAESGDYENVGDIAKFYFYLLEESKWKYVKKVVITRKIN